jgi:hypothetical protein
MSSKERVITLLKKRHQNYLKVSKEKLDQDIHWILNNPLSGRDLQEWIEFGVNTIMSEMGCDRTRAEIEMSWIEASYTTTIKQ